MKITVEADTPQEIESGMEPIVVNFVRRFAITGQAVEGDFGHSHGFWPDLQGDIERLIRHVEWQIAHPPELKSSG